MNATLRRKKAKNEARSAAEHTAQAATDLGSAVGRMASSGATYAGYRAQRASKAVVDSPAAAQVRGKARQVGDSGRETLDRWQRRGRRVVTVALVAGLAYVAQQVRSQPVPPDLERY